MYFGSFSKARVAVRGYEISGLETEYVALELDPFGLNLLQSVTTRTVSTARPLSGSPQVRLSDESALRLSQLGLAVPPAEHRAHAGADTLDPLGPDPDGRARRLITLAFVAIVWRGR